jgi:hypothetical protein
MSRIQVLALVAALAACRSLPQVPQPPVLPNGPVRISSLESDFFNNVALFIGRYAVFADSIVVEFDSAAVIRRNNYPAYPSPKHFDSLSVGLGVPYYKGDYTWNTQRDSRGFATPRLLHVGDTLIFTNLRFVIPRKGADNLAQAWLVLSLHETVITPGRDGRTGYASAYAHSQCDVFISRESKPPCR